MPPPSTFAHLWPPNLRRPRHHPVAWIWYCAALTNSRKELLGSKLRNVLPKHFGASRAIMTLWCQKSFKMENYFSVFNICPIYFSDMIWSNYPHIISPPRGDFSTSFLFMISSTPATSVDVLFFQSRIAGLTVRCAAGNGCLIFVASTKEIAQCPTHIEQNLVQNHNRICSFLSCAWVHVRNWFNGFTSMLDSFVSRTDMQEVLHSVTGTCNFLSVTQAGLSFYFGFLALLKYAM